MMAVVPDFDEPHLEAMDGRNILQLSRFAKWSTVTPNIKEGDVVCIRNEHTAPTKWPLARIVQVHPGSD